MKTAVLLLLFNRPQYVQQVFKAIRDAKPPRLYVAADGPRRGHPEDIKLCAQARQVIEQIDWPCELHTLFRDTNLSCKRAVSEAITWFFEHEEQGIILEDDCYPSPVFFVYAEELLDKYANNKNIVHIGAYTEVDIDYPKDCDYYFSRYMMCWGWASWRRAWALYQPDFKDSELDTFIEEGNLHKTFSNKYVAEHIQQQLRRNAIKTNTWSWDWTYQYCLLKNGGLSINPTVNLIENLDATAKTGTRRAAKSFSLPLRHPQKIANDDKTFCTWYQKKYPIKTIYYKKLIARTLATMIAAVLPQKQKAWLLNQQKKRWS